MEALEEINGLVKELNEKISLLDIDQLRNSEELTKEEMLKVIDELVSAKMAIQEQANEIGKVIRRASPASLSTMPPEVLTIILEKLDLKSFFTCRQVSKRFLKLADDRALYSMISTVMCRFDDWDDDFFEISLATDDGHNPRSRFRQQISNDNRILTAADKSQSMATVAWGMFSEILNIRTSPFDNLSICFSRDVGNRQRNQEQFERLLSEYLQSRSNKLQTKRLSVQGRIQQIMSVLPHIKPLVLEELCIEEWYNRSPADLENIVNTEQGRGLKKITFTTDIDESLLVPHFTHFKECEVIVEKLNHEVLVHLRNSFLRRNSTMKSFTLKSDIVDAMAVFAFGEPPAGNRPELLWTFQSAKPDMCLAVKVDGDCICYFWKQVEH